MSRHLFTHCALRLGDNLAHLHFLRKLAQAYPEKRFGHFAHERYLPQLEAVVADVPAISLIPLRGWEAQTAGFWPNAEPPAAYGSVNAWKNAASFWETHPRRFHYTDFMLEWFARLAAEMGLVTPLKNPADLLFDYPAALRDPLGPRPDVLIVNSAPQSNQAPDYRKGDLDAIALDLAKIGLRVITTEPVEIEDKHVRAILTPSLSVTGFGRISNFCKIVVGVATGPIWPTLNIRSTIEVHTRIHICLEEVGLAGAMTAPSALAARDILKRKGLL